MGKKLYCGNLSYNVASSDLGTRFSANTAPFKVLRSSWTATPVGAKASALFEMQNDQEAQAAITGVNGKEHDGRTLTVNEARPREIATGGGGGGGWWSRRLRRWRWWRRGRRY